MDPVLERITQARVTLLFKHPFFGSLAMGWRIVDASSWCPTAATDIRNLYYNRDFILKLNQSELVFLLVHELLHIVFDHFGRRGSRNPGLWNMANDYIVNGILVEEKIGTMPSEVVVRHDKSKDGISQRIGLYKEKYQGWTSEEVYEDLDANSVEIVLTLDEHLEIGEDQNPGSVRVIGEDGPPQITAEEAKRIRDEFRSAMIEAAQSAAGRVPAGVKRLIDELVEPKMDWRHLIDIHIQSTRRRDYSYSHPSRKSQQAGIVLPGQEREKGIEVAVAIDGSGSVSEEMLRDFMSEIHGIIQQFADYTLDVWSFDAAVYNHQTFTPENADEFLSYDVEGSGGTIFEANWDYMRENDIQPQRLILFTDGHPNAGWGEPDYCPTLFVIHGNPSIEAPFGITAHYEPERGK